MTIKIRIKKTHWLPARYDFKNVNLFQTPYGKRPLKQIGEHSKCNGKIFIVAG